MPSFCNKPQAGDVVFNCDGARQTMNLNVTAPGIWEITVYISVAVRYTCKIASLQGDVSKKGNYSLVGAW